MSTTVETLLSELDGLPITERFVRCCDNATSTIELLLFEPVESKQDLLDFIESLRFHVEEAGKLYRERLWKWPKATDPVFLGAFTLSADSAAATAIVCATAVLNSATKHQHKENWRELVIDELAESVVDFRQYPKLILRRDVNELWRKIQREQKEFESRMPLVDYRAIEKAIWLQMEADQPKSHHHALLCTASAFADLMECDEEKHIADRIVRFHARYHQAAQFANDKGDPGPVVFSGVHTAMEVFHSASDLLSKAINIKERIKPEAVREILQASGLPCNVMQAVAIEKLLQEQEKASMQQRAKPESTTQVEPLSEEEFQERREELVQLFAKKYHEQKKPNKPLPNKRGIAESIGVPKRNIEAFIQGISPKLVPRVGKPGRSKGSKNK